MVVVYFKVPVVTLTQITYTKLLSLSRSRDDTFTSIHMGPSTLPEEGLSIFSVASVCHLLLLDRVQKRIVILVSEGLGVNVTTSFPS